MNQIKRRYWINWRCRHCGMTGVSPSEDDTLPEAVCPYCIGGQLVSLLTN